MQPAQDSCLSQCLLHVSVVRVLSRFAFGVTAYLVGLFSQYFCLGPSHIYILFALQSDRTVNISTVVDNGVCLFHCLTSS